jgi:hypothetical protein
MKSNILKPRTKFYFFKKNNNLFLRFKSTFKKIKFLFYFFIYFKLIFFGILNHFNALISKIIFKKLKPYYFNIFLNEKYFKKQSKQTLRNIMIV